jgi:hypothetical protein
MRLMYAPNLSESLEQARALHEKLASTAHGLYFACEDVALVLEARLPPGAYAPPGGGSVLVQRWRRAGDLALQVARVWEGYDLPDVLPSQPIPGKDEVANVCDTVVRDLFRVTMGLANLERLAEEPLQSLIDTVVGELDQVIVVLREGAAQPPPPRSVTVGKVGIRPLRRELRAVDWGPKTLVATCRMDCHGGTGKATYMRRSRHECTDQAHIRISVG